MAKSKSGGTRAYIRGKIGADVYAIGKDGKGAKQQVARSLAEVVSNPRTQGQVRSRMILCGVSQLVHALRPIIDHSFDGIAPGQPSVSHFRKLALQAFTEDAKSADPKFGYLPEGSKLIPNGDITISSGKAVMPIPFLDSMGNQYSSGFDYGGYCAYIPWREEEGGVSPAKISGAEAFNLFFKGDPRNSYTYVGLIEISDRESGELVGVKPAFCRVSYNPSQEQLETMYDEWDPIPGYGGIHEGNIKLSFYCGFGQYSDGVSVSCEVAPNFENSWGSDYRYKAIAQAFIWSEHVPGKGMIHSNTAFLMRVPYQEGFGAPTEYFDYPSKPVSFADALATYPVGASRFLDGGDI